MADDTAVAEPQPEKPETTHVKGAGTDNTVAFYEQHPDHPDGQAMVANDGRVHEVAKTPDALKAIADKRIVETDEEVTPPPVPTPQPGQPVVQPVAPVNPGVAWTPETPPSPPPTTPKAAK